MHRVLHLERRHHGAGGEHVELQAAARHVVDLLGVVDGELVEDVLGRPGRLVFPGHGLCARDLRHGDGGRAGDSGTAEKLTAGRDVDCLFLVIVMLTLPRIIYPVNIYVPGLIPLARLSRSGSGKPLSLQSYGVR